MNKYKSITKYRKKLESNPFAKLLEKIKVEYTLKRAIKEINTEELQKIQNEYRDFDPYPGYSKYLNLEPWMLDNVWRVYILGLNDEKNKNILDIGTGNGYFPYLCKRYGHNVRTIDVDSNPIFNELIKLLDIPRLNYSVTKFNPIPPFDIKFDVVTGFHTYFNGHRTDDVWTSTEWDFFLKDLRDNLCNPGAEAYFIINKEHDSKEYFAQELYTYFIEKQAEIDNNRVYFRNLDSI